MLYHANDSAAHISLDGSRVAEQKNINNTRGGDA